MRNNRTLVSSLRIGERLGHLSLAIDFARRELRERYVATQLGNLWFMLSPLVMILVYTVVFSDFMKMKLNIVEGPYSYSIYLLAGILPWTTFNTLILRLNMTILEKAYLIKKINVPIYVFLLATVLSEGVVFVISILLALCFLLLIGHHIGPAFLWLLPLMVLQLLFTLGLGTIFGLLTPFLRDLSEALPVGLQLWFWMTPIVYIPEMIEKKLPWLLTLNPIYPFIKAYHGIFLYGRIPDLTILSTMAAETLLMLGLAAWFYIRLVAGIKDIL